jgi:hypothetical protein
MLLGRLHIYGQRDFYYEPLKWTIRIPEGFKSIPPMEVEEMGKQGLEMLGIKEKINLPIHIIFALRIDEYHYMDAKTITCSRAQFDTIYASWKKATYSSFEIMKSTFPTTDFEITFSKDSIAGLVFNTSLVNVDAGNNNKLSYYSFINLIDSKAFAINLIALDPNKKKEILSAIRNSRIGIQKY